MDYEKVKGIVDAVQHVYQVCTTIFDGLRNPRADADYIHADEETVEERTYAQASQEHESHVRMRKRRKDILTTEIEDAIMDEEFRKVCVEYERRSEQEVRGSKDRKAQYLRKNHLVDAAAQHAKFSKFQSCIRSVHDKFDSNLGTHNATTVLEAIPTCYDRILRQWKNDSLGFRDLGSSNVEQLNQAVAQVEESIVTVILDAMTEVSESLRKETGGNQHFQLCKSKFDAAASHLYSPKSHYNPDMIKFLCDVQGAIVTWRAYGQDRASPEPTKKIKIMQSIVRICIYSQPEIFNNEEDLDEDIRNRLNEAPSLVTLDTHVSPITLKLAQLLRMHVATPI